MSLLDCNPAYDNKITKKYSQKTIEHKSANRKTMLQEYGWETDPKRMIVAMPEGIPTTETGEQLEALLPALLTLPIGIVIRGKGPKKYGELLARMAQEHPEKIAIVDDGEESIRALLAGSDASIFLSGHESDELICALRYGSVPIALPSQLLQNYNPTQESGNAFVIQGNSVWHFFAAMVRALETFTFPYDFRTIQKNAMNATEENDEDLND